MPGKQRESREHSHHRSSIPTTNNDTRPPSNNSAKSLSSDKNNIENAEQVSKVPPTPLPSDSKSPLSSNTSNVENEQTAVDSTNPRPSIDLESARELIASIHRLGADGHGVHTNEEEGEQESGDSTAFASTHEDEDTLHESSCSDNERSAHLEFNCGNDYDTMVEHIQRDGNEKVEAILQVLSNYRMLLIEQSRQKTARQREWDDQITTLRRQHKKESGKAKDKACPTIEKMVIRESKYQERIRQQTENLAETGLRWIECRERALEALKAGSKQEFEQYARESMVLQIKLVRKLYPVAKYLTKTGRLDELSELESMLTF